MRTTTLDCSKIAKKYDVTEDEVWNIYHDTFEFIHNTASSFDFTTLTDSDLDNMRTSFQIPGLGKLFLNRDRLHRFLKKWKKI